MNEEYNAVVELCEDLVYVVICLSASFIVLLFFYIALFFTDSRKADQDERLITDIRKVVREEMGKYTNGI